MTICLSVLVIILGIAVLFLLKKNNKSLDEINSLKWKIVSMRRELNLLNNSIVEIEDDFPEKITTASIGMKLSNEMLSYVEIDEDKKKIRARMLKPEYNIDDYYVDHTDEL